MDQSSKTTFHARKSILKGMFPGNLFIISGICLFSLCAFASPMPILPMAARTVAGLLVFTFIEYWIHRKLFHLKPRTPFRKRLQHLIHGQHHLSPQDNGHLGMTPFASLIILGLLLLAGYYGAGFPGLAFISGFLLGYGWYLFAHFVVHNFPMPGNFLKALWENHHIHHFKSSRKAFGVSSPLWDYVFGTLSLRSAKGERKRIK